MAERFLFALALVLIPLAGLRAQQAGAWRDADAHRDTLDLSGPQPFRLRPYLLPGSARVYLDGEPLDSTRYRIEPEGGRLWLLPPLPDSTARLVAVYRTFPFRFREAYFRNRAAADTAAADRSAARRPPPGGAPPAVAADPFGESRLQRSGSISRGLIAGNSRDLSIESGFRMQLSGEISPGVSLQAVLTDENTPIQPEGTTQRLSDFDRVFIQLESARGTATLGDFDLVLQGTEFARFSRKLQGASAVARLPDLPGGLFGGGEVTVAGATTRGIFRSQQIAALEGVQGPYRLEGREGEQFILVIAGSEQVYLDGVRMERGETADYVIDYATGELTFTARRLITAERRITVDFEYTTNRFTRTLVGSRAEARLAQRAGGGARLRLGASFLREADSRAFNEELGLSASDSLLLALAGDRPARRSGAELVPFDPEAPYVQYVRRDTVIGNERQEAFVAATAPADSVYRLRFSRTEPGQGRYRRAEASVNGILYEFVGAGGDYDAVRILPSPREQQMLDLHGAFEPLPGLELFGEWASSLHDLNRFSTLDEADDVGGAYHAGLRLRPTPLAVRGRSLGRLSGELRRRLMGANFEAFDRTRPVEFERRWNIPRTVPVTGPGAAQDEALNEASLLLEVTPRSLVRAEWGTLRSGDLFDGARTALHLRADEVRLPRVDYRLEAIRSRDRLVAQEGEWLRHLLLARQPLLAGRLTPFVEVEAERRLQRALETDSLTPDALRFVELRPGVEWRSGPLRWSGSLQHRAQEEADEGALHPAFRAWTGRADVEYRPHRDFQTEAGAGYRVKHVRERFRLERQEGNAESVAIRWTNRFTPLRRAVEATSLYEALTERTPILQETYVRTGPELGQFVWEDANGDQIRQLDEFVPERTPYEGTYYKTLVPTDRLVPVINVEARLSLRLDPSRYWPRPETRWQRMLANVSSRTVLEVLEKSRERELRHIYLLNLRRFRDTTNTVNGRLRVAQELAFFRNEARFGGLVTFNGLRAMNRLAGGLEERRLDAWRFEARYRPAAALGLRVTAAVERNLVLSGLGSAFDARTFDIRSRSLEPEATLHLGRRVQLSAGPVLARKTDRLGERRARILRLPAEARYAVAQRLDLALRVERANVRLRGAARGLAAYELTEGRGPGVSYLWNLSGQYMINRFLRASLLYDGRVPADASPVHTLRMQLSAIF